MVHNAAVKLAFRSYYKCKPFSSMIILVTSQI